MSKIQVNPTRQALLKAFKTLKLLGFTLRDYQVKGVHWMISNELKSPLKGGILADDPGLGKTVQTAALMVGIIKKTLIIVPKPVLSQWIIIMEKVFPGEVYIHYGREKVKSREELRAKNFMVCITTHGSCMAREKNIFETLVHLPGFWERLIIDEGHVIRNHKTKMYKTMMNFIKLTESRWLLTGTPVQNKRLDIINLLSFIGMGTKVLNSQLEFYISKYLLRRTKLETLIRGNGILEEYTTITKINNFKTIEEQTAYDEIESFSMMQLADCKYGGGSIIDFQIMLLETMFRLRQATSSPQIAIESMRKKYGDDIIKNDFEGISSKIREVTNDIMCAEGLSLVFCHFHREMELIQNLLGKKNVESRIYSGKLSVKERDNVLKEYINPDMGVTVLIIQIMAGGVGLNLQNFSNVFILSPDWNPCNEIQAIARAHRYGQKKKVTVTKYVAGYNTLFSGPEDNRTTIDQRILHKQIVKRDMMAELLSDNTLKFKESVVRMGCLVDIDIETIITQFPL